MLGLLAETFRILGKGALLLVRRRGIFCVSGWRDCIKFWVLDIYMKKPWLYVQPSFRGISIVSHPV